MHAEDLRGDGVEEVDGRPARRFVAGDVAIGAAAADLRLERGHVGCARAASMVRPSALIRTPVRVPGKRRFGPKPMGAPCSLAGDVGLREAGLDEDLPVTRVGGDAALRADARDTCVQVGVVQAVRGERHEEFAERGQRPVAAGAIGEVRGGIREHERARVVERRGADDVVAHREAALGDEAAGVDARDVEAMGHGRVLIGVVAARVGEEETRAVGAEAKLLVVRRVEPRALERVVFGAEEEVVELGAGVLREERELLEIALAPAGCRSAT